MGILTLRLNDWEEKILAHLQDYYDEDKSKILKEAMLEKFEELRDREVIEEYEKKAKSRKVKFENADALVRRLSKELSG